MGGSITVVVYKCKKCLMHDVDERVRNVLCQKCQKRPANVHFTKIVNNKKVEMYLCEQCANKEGNFNITSPLSITDFLSGFFNYNDDERYIQNIKQKESCPKCGMRFEEFQKDGKFGCGECYKTYKDKLTPILKRLHGGVQHTGKVPSTLSKNMEVSEQINKLKRSLDEVIQREEYEKAAEIRDKIRALENRDN